MVWGRNEMASFLGWSWDHNYRGVLALRLLRLRTGQELTLNNTNHERLDIMECEIERDNHDETFAVEYYFGPPLHYSTVKPLSLISVGVLQFFLKESP